MLPFFQTLKPCGVVFSLCVITALAKIYNDHGCRVSYRIYRMLEMWLFAREHNRMPGAVASIRRQRMTTSPHLVP